MDTAAVAARMFAACLAEGQAARRVPSDDDAATMRRKPTPPAG